MGLFGGDSSSTSKTENTNIDQKLMLEQGATGVSASGNASVTMLDGGAIAGAFGMGNHAIDSVTNFATGALSGAYHTSEMALSGALSSVSSAKDAYESASQQVASAYEDAKVGNRSTMMMGVFVVGAIALVLVARKVSA